MLAQPRTLYGAVSFVPTTIKNHVVKIVIKRLISPDENNNIGLVYTQELMVSKKFDNFAKRTARITEIGLSGYS